MYMLLILTIPHNWACHC